MKQVETVESAAAAPGKAHTTAGKVAPGVA